MRLLLDTHAFIWWDSKPELLSKRVLAMLEDWENTPVISVANFWEIQIKSASGKMDLTMPPETIFRSYGETDTEILPITFTHVMTLNNLPEHHRDPFDRILVAQAVTENIPIISKDSKISQYPVTVIW